MYENRNLACRELIIFVKENADYLASTTLEAIGALFVEKRTNRKNYYEEHARICNDLNKLQDSVAKVDM